MNELASWSFALVMGVALGGVFFGGLHWTLPRALASRWPPLWLGASALLRTALVLAGVWWTAFAGGGGDWRRLLACGLGFVVVQGLLLSLPQRNAAVARMAGGEAG